jgi:hypothetical protein
MTKPKLSDVLLQGAALRPQAFGAYTKNGGTCALGAMYEALTGTLPPENDSEVIGTIMQATGERLADVVYDGTFSLSNMIALKNDAGWTREDIAVWLIG